MSAWGSIRTIIKRELGGYFVSPVAYVFLVIFLLLTGFFTFTIGNFFERGEASLISFFTWHPWLYLFLVPAIGMRLWADERRTGTVELLLTLPIPIWASVRRSGTTARLRLLRHLARGPRESCQSPPMFRGHRLRRPTMSVPNPQEQFGDQVVWLVAKRPGVDDGLGG